MGKIAVLMFTAFVDMIGTVMIVPLLPFYAERLGASALMIGVLVSAFSIAQLASAPLWGWLSDHHGRRPVLLAGLALSAVSYAVFGLADSLWLLFLSRAVQGLGGGTVGVVQAYVADTSAPEERAKALGWLSAATSLGAVVGPALGSALAAWGGQMAPGIGAAVVCALNLAFAWFWLRESHEHDVAVPRRGATREVRRAVWNEMFRPGETAARLVWTYTVAIGAFYGMIAVFTLFLARRFGVTEKTIFPYFMWFGASGVVFRTFLLGPAVRRWGEVRLTRAGLVSLAAGIALLPLARSLPTALVAITLMPLGTAFTFPCVTSLLSRIVPQQARGLYLGVQQTLGGVSRVVFPWWYGWTFDHLGMITPFWSCALLTLGALGFLVGMERRVAVSAPSARSGGVVVPPDAGPGLAPSTVTTAVTTAAPRPDA